MLLEFREERRESSRARQSLFRRGGKKPKIGDCEVAKRAEVAYTLNRIVRRMGAHALPSDRSLVGLKSSKELDLRGTGAVAALKERQQETRMRGCAHALRGSPRGDTAWFSTAPSPRPHGSLPRGNAPVHGTD